MEAVIHKQIETLFNILPRWTELKDNFHEITIFQDINWIESWWHYKSKQKKITPYIVEIKQGNNTIGIVPLYCSYKKIGSFLFRILKPIGSDLSDYLFPILSKEFSHEKQLSLAFEKILEDKSSWDFIEWVDIPEHSFFDSFLNNHLLKKSSLIERNITHNCPFLNLSRDIEEVKLKFDEKFLKDIHYKIRKLNRKGEINFTKVLTEHEIEPVMNKLFKFHCQRWEEKNTPSRFRNSEERKQAIIAAKNLFKSNLLHLTYLSHNNEIIAVHFGMSDGDKLYYYIPAFDVKFGKYSVGNILVYNLILQACREGSGIFDFLRGNENYKKQWGTFNKFNVRYVFFNHSLKSWLFKSIYFTYNSKYLKLYNQKFIKNRLLAE
ncbi:GNAT family N-acetyltransferase [Neobacillus drentensis]|uniref:GNAT family N-acetyltransferase n=1 Tax=Neobacillus drentensis TaxID=220684 RepID=UPI00285C136E|nr:GNAT family N-acetyltransferase [Neobacillus drentensis]MDR7239965.1 CelD/BcsL family acetyltransferase involved in cellulose biosynthesis [Neobacillus drentensis]